MQKNKRVKKSGGGRGRKKKEKSASEETADQLIDTMIKEISQTTDYKYRHTNVRFDSMYIKTLHLYGVCTLPQNTAAICGLNTQHSLLTHRPPHPNPPKKAENYDKFPYSIILHETAFKTSVCKHPFTASGRRLRFEILNSTSMIASRPGNIDVK